MNYVESFNLFGVEAKQIPCIRGNGAPTEATEGAVGCFYIDRDNGKLYKCVASESGNYTWSIIEGEKGEKGEAGTDGVTPHIGDNGNWWIGDEDTGVAAALAGGATVVQTTGDSETEVMSQKAVTDFVLNRMQKLEMVPLNDYISIDTVNGTVTIPAKTELIANGYHKNLSSPINLTLNTMINTSGNLFLYNKTSEAFERFSLSQIKTVDTSNYYYAFFVRRNTSAGAYYRPSSDISAPYYVNGELFGVSSEIPRMAMILGKDYISIDTVKGTVTIPAGTDLFIKGFKKTLSAATVITLNPLSSTSSSIILYDKVSDTFSVKPIWDITTKSLAEAGMFYIFSVRRSGTGFPTSIDIDSPYYVNGVLFGACEGLNKPDNTKPKEFAELFYNTDKAEAFMFFTDPHLCAHAGDAWRTEFNEYMLKLKTVYTESAVTRVFCGGDWIGGNIANAKDACYRLGLVDAKMREYFKEYYNIRGNHESNFEYDFSQPTLDCATIRNLMFRNEGKTYYTVDGNYSKYFIFDTQNEPSNLYDAEYETEQCIWFAEQLQNNNVENIIMMLHMAYNPYNSDTLQSCTNRLLQIAEAFNNRTSITVVSGGTAYNFANATGKVRYLMAGHSHIDRVTTINGIPVILTTHLRDGDTPSFDLCLTNYDTNKLHLVRIGTGENRTVDI